jgi:hypothetical protein
MIKNIYKFFEKGLMKKHIEHLLKNEKCLKEVSRKIFIEEYKIIFLNIRKKIKYLIVEGDVILMSEKILIISSIASLSKTFYDLLSKMEKGDKIKIERAEKFFYLATKVEMNLFNLILYVYGKHNEKILEFINAVKK